MRPQIEVRRTFERRRWAVPACLGHRHNEKRRVCDVGLATAAPRCLPQCLTPLGRRSSFGSAIVRGCVRRPSHPTRARAEAFLARPPASHRRPGRHRRRLRNQHLWSQATAPKALGGWSHGICACFVLFEGHHIPRGARRDGVLHWSRRVRVPSYAPTVLGDEHASRKEGKVGRGGTPDPFAIVVAAFVRCDAARASQLFVQTPQRLVASRSPRSWPPKSIPRGAQTHSVSAATCLCL